MNLPSLTPGFVHSVDRDRREVRVQIPGITDGDDYPVAEMVYAVGDNSENTEIRINEGDRVWLSFENGDKRYPLIMGYRPKQTGNEVGWRRWFHDNFEITADGTVKINCTDFILNATNSITQTTKTAKLTTETNEVDASESASLTTPQNSITATTAHTGDLGIAGGITQTAGESGGNGITTSGAIKTTSTIHSDDAITTNADVTAGDISLKGHHTAGVQGGNDTSGLPVP